MKIVTTTEMRELDRRTIEEAGIPGLVLMERAGRGVARVILEIASRAEIKVPSVLLLAGRGNNGGDALVAARALKEAGARVEVWMAAAEEDVRGDAHKQLALTKKAKIGVRSMVDSAEWDREARLAPPVDFLVDGLLGTGTAGPAREPIASAIRFIRAKSDRSRVVAIDVPSGLNADTGETEGNLVQADVTVTMGLPKVGLMASGAMDWIGNLEVVDIGIPSEYVNQTAGVKDVSLIDASDLRPLFPRRKRSAHKGDFGHVLLIGGARGYTGAIAMAARAALRSGAGLVTLLVPESIAPVVTAMSPESMVKGVSETSAGSLSYDWWDAWRQRVDTYDAVLLGPGLTRHDQSLQLVRAMIRDCAAPMVLDADALSVLEGQPHWIDRSRAPVVITPHPGEMARLMGRPTEMIQEDRIGWTRKAAEETGAVVALKGAGTLVAKKDKPTQINLTGNPGMATGGSGDVLAGLLTALIGQKLDPWDAARAAVYLHGLAGDRAAWRKSQPGLIAGDIIDELPNAFHSLTPC